MPLRIVSYNIRFGGGRRVPLIGQFLNALEPDVAILQEASDPLAVERLAAITGLGYTACRPGVSVAVMARSPLLHQAWHDPPRIRSFVEFSPADSDLRFVGLHFPSGLSRRGERRRSRTVEVLLATIGQADGRTVLIGDLNSVARGDEPMVAAMPFWLRLLLRFDGSIRTEVMERLTTAGWIDAFRSLHPAVPGFTLPAGAPQVRLDYLLVPRAVLPRVQHCEPAMDPLLAARASDHLPLVSLID